MGQRLCKGCLVGDKLMSVDSVAQSELSKLESYEDELNDLEKKSVHLEQQLTQQIESYKQRLSKLSEEMTERHQQFERSIEAINKQMEEENEHSYQKIVKEIQTQIDSMVSYKEQVELAVNTSEAFGTYLESRGGVMQWIVDQDYMMQFAFLSLDRLTRMKEKVETLSKTMKTNTVNANYRLVKMQLSSRLAKNYLDQVID